MSYRRHASSSLPPPIVILDISASAEIPLTYLNCLQTLKPRLIVIHTRQPNISVGDSVQHAAFFALRQALINALPGEDHILFLEDDVIFSSYFEQALCDARYDPAMSFYTFYQPSQGYGDVDIIAPEMIYSGAFYGTQCLMFPKEAVQALLSNEIHIVKNYLPGYDLRWARFLTDAGKTSYTTRHSYVQHIGTSSRLGCMTHRSERFISASTKVAIFCHHKCASDWLAIGICGSLADCLNLKVSHVDSNLMRLKSGHLDYYVGAVLNRFEVFVDRNSSCRTVDAIARTENGFRGIHLVRDPRDMLVSAYFSHRNTHTATGWIDLAKHREKLLSMSLEDGLLSEIDFNASFFRDMLEWELHPQVLELRFEEVVVDELRHVLSVCDWLQWDVSRAVIVDIVKRNSFEQRTGRNKGNEDQWSHYRKGIVGNWKNYFTPRVKLTFYARYTDLLMKWGYRL